MKNVRIILLIGAGLLAAACGKDEGEQPAETTAAAPAASSPARPSAGAASIADDKSSIMDAIEGMPGGGTRYIDHAKDEIEFGLKKSIAGLESLLEDVSDSDQMAMIKKDIAGLKAKLEAL